LTVQENVLLGLSIKGVVGKVAEERATAILGEVGLSERMDFLPRDLSGGQKQRVAVARALAANTPIILADEPTGNLDFSNGRNVMEILRRLAVEQQRCVVVATHDNRIEDLFDRILYMEDGEISRERRSH
jgi:putative ABC transport system ATP-binding protein